MVLWLPAKTTNNREGERCFDSLWRYALTPLCRASTTRVSIYLQRLGRHWTGRGGGTIVFGSSVRLNIELIPRLKERTNNPSSKTGRWTVTGLSVSMITRIVFDDSVFIKKKKKLLFAKKLRSVMKRTIYCIVESECL